MGFPLFEIEKVWLSYFSTKYKRVCQNKMENIEWDKCVADDKPGVFVLPVVSVVCPLLWAGRLKFKGETLGRPTCPIPMNLLCQTIKFCSWTDYERLIGHFTNLLPYLFIGH